MNIQLGKTAPQDDQSRRVACVRVGQYRAAQGDLVWRRGNTACVRVFSKLVVGTLI